MLQSKHQKEIYMKRQLFLIDNEQGFYLPIVLIVTTITLSFISILIYTYQNELHMTEAMINQIEAETLIQMAVEDFTEMVVIEETMEAGTISFDYPNGIVEINYEQLEAVNWQLNCTIDFATKRPPFKASFKVAI